MRILVTGSSGQLGSAIANDLSRRHHEVVGLDLVAGQMTANVGSIADRALVFHLMRNIDAVVHTASLHAAHLGSHDPQAFVETNINGTINLLDAAAEHGVRRFIYTSTTSVYGHAMESATEAVWVTEDLAPRPRDIYDITKLAAEQLCAVAARTSASRSPASPMTCITLRVSRFFPEPEDLIAIYRLYRGVDVRDAATAHVLAVESAPAALAAPYDVFNISAASPFGRDQLYQLKHRPERTLRAMFPWIDGCFTRRGWRLPASIDRVYVTDKAQRLLGYRPRFGLVQYLQSLGEPLPPPSPAARPDHTETLWP